MKAKKTLLIVAAMLLVAAISVGGTLAYLQAQSSTVKNTFVAKELGTVEVTENTGETYYVVPGEDLKKDPVLKFTRGTTNTDDDVDAYVFVEVTSSDWKLQSDSKTYKNAAGMTFVIASDWTYLSGNVFYTTVSAGSGLSGLRIIDNDKVIVPSTITESTIANAVGDVTFQGYAIQKPGFDTPAKAWAEIGTPTDGRNNSN